MEKITLEKKDIEELINGVREASEKSFDEALDKTLSRMKEENATEIKSVVDRMLAERYVRGRDITGLSDEQKADFAQQVKTIYQQQNGKNAAALRVKSFGDGLNTKANEALIEEQDSRGGYLVSNEVAAAILRIAASVGTILKQAQHWDMKTDELGIPNFTGAFLAGSYVGVDIPGTVTGIGFGQAVLIARKWQLAFTVGNDLLADANVNLGEWLMTLAGEALANMIDMQGFIGGTKGSSTGPYLGSETVVPGPFVGILNTPGVNTYQLGSGKTTFVKFDPVVDASNVVATLEEAILDKAAFYFHRTVWAGIRATLASTSGIPYLYLGGLAGPEGLQYDPTGGPIKAAGSMGGFPVYTNRWLPSTSTTTQANAAFGVFGNLEALAFGNKGGMSVAYYESGSFGGKEIALADQRGIVYRHRHALVVALPKAFTVIIAAAS